MTDSLLMFNIAHYIWSISYAQNFGICLCSHLRWPIVIILICVCYVCVHMFMCICVCQDWSWQLLDSRLVLQWLQFTSLVFRGCQIKFWLLPLISRVTSIWQPVTWRWETNFCNAIYIECTSDNVQLIVAE